MRRIALIAVVGALLAGCGGGEETTAQPETVEGTVATETETGTETAETGETETETETTAEQPAGDPQAGQQVFAANGCGGCHTFGPANANGTTGPNLDELPEQAEGANQPLVEFTRESIVEPDAYVEEGFPRGVMPAYDELDEKQLNDLVAFLTQT